MTDMTSPNIQLLRNTYAAFGRADIDAVVAAMHPDIAWHEAEHSPWHAAGGHHGPTEVLTNVFGRIPGTFDRFEVHPTRFHDAGDVVVVEGRYRARSATNAQCLDAQVCHVWTIRDGRLAGFQQYTDTWQFAVLTRPAAPR
jgi:uncharacterized protein